ncbi:hypothetical protein OUZ56_014994 [Daphnia magna]|uniref:Uncharacterized protein n=1 Tax=Daphnia magna TaxID=35525 RepID=A0ABR0ALG5_9CRUS|nr:hypothetical protein OUZ56_014994 [Daphnia magna]
MSDDLSFLYQFRARLLLVQFDDCEDVSLQTPYFLHFPDGRKRKETTIMKTDHFKRKEKKLYRYTRRNSIREKERERQQPSRRKGIYSRHGNSCGDINDAQHFLMSMPGCPRIHTIHPLLHLIRGIRSKADGHSTKCKAEQKIKKLLCRTDALKSFIGN